MTQDETLQCQDPEGCARWAAERATIMAQRLPQAERLHDTFLRRLEQGTSEWEPWAHAAERQILRATARAEIEEVLLCGHPIEAAFFGGGAGRMLLRGDTASGRPLIVVCEFPRPRRQAVWPWSIVTAFDPRTEAWRWSADFERRVCRCHPHARYASQER